jgi:hypothetical protein
VYSQIAIGDSEVSTSAVVHFVDSSRIYPEVREVPEPDSCTTASITLSGWASSLSGISLRIRSAQSTSGRVCQAFGIVGEEPAPVSYSTISVGEIRFQI